MKKLIFSLSALAALLLAGSCQRENLEPVQQGGTVTYTVQVPGALATKAVGDYELIYEVYREAQVGTSADPIYEGTKTFSGNSVDLPLEFVKDQNFVVLFWAQKEDLTAYNTGDLRNVTISAEHEFTANNDDYEVFAGNDTVINCQSQNNGEVSLVRPVAQINIATTKAGLILSPVGSERPKHVELVNSDVNVYGLWNSFNVAINNVLDETVAGNTNVEFTATSSPAKSPNSVEYDSEHLLVAKSYVGFIPQNGATVKVVFNLETSDDGTINHEVSNVPVKPNFKTNIIGNLISATADYNVTLGAWGTEETNVEVVTVSTAQDLQEAIDNIQTGAEGNIILEGDIDLGALFGASTLSVTKAGNAQLPIVIDENKAMTLDLNGFTITTPWEDETAGKHYYAFENHGTLNIVDSKVNGKIKARGIFNYGKMTLESGTIEACDGNGGYGVRNYKGAEFVMNGGTVATIYEDGDIPGEGYDASPIRVDQGAKAEIKGGIINNVSNFTVAIDNYGETIVDDGTFTSVHTTLANSAVMTINGGSFTCNGLEGITAHALWAAAGTTTINGGTFNGKDNYNGFNVDASKGATVYIKGGEFLPVHSGSLYGEGTIIVTGGTFFDEVPVKYLAAGYSCQQNEEGKWIVPQVALAKIGEVSYPTLAAAIDAVSEDAPATITVQAAVFTDESIVIPAGKSITLDLNGMSITGPKGGAYAITNNGILTIDDSQTVGVINGVVYDGPGAQTVINGGTYNAHVGEAYVFLNNAGRLTINNATINGGTTYPVYSYNEDNSLVINNVVINATFGCVNAYGTNGSVEINGGTFKMTGVQGNTSHIAYFSKNCTAIINGGTFEKIGNISMSGTGGGGICVNGGAGLTINGGSFAGDYDDVYNYGGSIIVKGGTYKFKPDFLAEDYKAVENADGLWVVITATVKNEAQLKEAFELSHEIVLGSDITLTENWTPVPEFEGIFDGNNHKIKGLKIEGHQYGSFIDTIIEGTVIKNVEFENVSITSATYASAVVSLADKNTTFENVKVSGTIEASAYASGILWYSYEGLQMKDCENRATINSNRSAGIVAWVETNAYLENVKNYSDITAGSAAGIANRFGGTIKNAYNYGDIIAEGSEPASGIVCIQKGASTYENCYNYGDITSLKDNVNASASGILGHTPSTAATLNYCANYGAITAENSYASGIGYSHYGSAKANYCYNSGVVTGAKGAGAIMAQAAHGHGDTASYCLNAATVTSTTGLVYQAAEKNVSSYYYDGTTLKSVADDSVVAEADALAVLNGGTDNDFFSTENGKITVK